MNIRFPEPLRDKKVLFYCDFASDAGHLGSCLVEFTEAEANNPGPRLTALGCNPGGELMILVVPDSAPFAHPRPEDMNRLITDSQELERVLNEPIKKIKDRIADGELTEEQVENGIANYGGTVCEACNEEQRLAN